MVESTPLLRERRGNPTEGSNPSRSAIPLIVNILAFHIFLTQGAGLLDPPLILICLLAAFLLWSGRKKFAGLLN